MKGRAKGLWAWGLVLLTLGLILFGAWLLIRAFTVPRTTVTAGSAAIHALIADTDDSRARGLGGVTTLGPSDGMLFIFDADGPQPIWMKDMDISIDIVWLDDAKRVVNVERNVAPSTYPERFTSEAPARYVLEVAAGTTARAGIKPGVQAAFDLP